jgi:uncharacterized protein (TIGR03437 family)
VKKLAVTFVFGWQLLHADTPNIRVVNAASFLEDTSLTPGAIISILGPNLANTTALATDLANVPHTLGNVTVTIRSTTLPLFYVSKTQINARIDPSIPLGAALLTVNSPTGTFTKNIVLSATSTPGIFSVFGTGTRDGAIQNAVTFALGPYTVTTNGTPTYLAIYTTGLDFSSAPTVSIGGVSVDVKFYGDSPCCPGLQQINVQLPAGLAGAGRVEVAVTAGGKTSNIVEVVILPNPGQGAFPPSGENKSRSREISSIAYSNYANQALVADENDDVLRIVDVVKRAVIHTLTLPEGAQPVAIAVNEPGLIAVVAERNRGKVAIVDLLNYNISAEATVGSGPSDVAISGTTALVVNQDSDSVSAVDIKTYQVKTVTVGRGPRGVAADTAANKAYVTNQDDGTVSVIDLTSLQVTDTINLPANSRPALIRVIPALAIAVITEPSGGSSGKVINVNLSNKSASTILVNVDRSGGANALAAYGNTVYFANQTGGSVSLVPYGASTSVVSIKVDLGARALAVDTTDKLLLVTNQGSGNISLVDLFTNKVTGRINAVKSENETEAQDRDNQDDRATAQNAPTITSISPASASAGSTFTITINGTNLQGADDIFFVDPSTLPGHGNGHAHDNITERGHGPFGTRDSNITVTNIQMPFAGTGLTATVTIGAKATPGQRVVRVETPNGDTSFAATTANEFQIN